MKMLRAALTTFLTCCVCAAQYAQTRPEPIEPIPAWYQMPPKQTQAAPGYYERREPSPYERIIQHNNAYQGYPPSSYGSRPYEPLPSNAPVIPARRYPSGQDASQGVITSIERYHQLLLKKYGLSMSTQEPVQQKTTRRPVTQSPRKRPKSLKRIYSTITPRTDRTRKMWKAVTSEGKMKPFKQNTITTETTTAQTTTTTTLPRKIERHTFRPLRRIEFATTHKPVQFKSTRRTFWDYIWPNSELIAAIKDVFAKFKASLDEAGLDQDVRLMRNQLQNTWQQIRSGLDRGLRVVKQSAENSLQQINGSFTPREIMGIGPSSARRIETPVDSRLERLDQILGPMNEQLGRIFESAAADSADTKQRATNTKN